MEKQILIPEVLLCSLCKNLYTDPRILSCQHSFCHPCLTNSLKSGFIQCHRCDFPNQIENLDALPKDELIQLTIETLRLDNSTVKCQECEKEEAKLYCENCSFNFCEECSNQKIHNSKTMKNHTFSQVKSHSFGRCKIHPGKEIEVYCKNCNLLICLKCSILDHKTHDLQDLKNATKGMMVEFKEKTQIKEKIEKIIKTSEILEQRKQKQQLHFNDIEKEINQISNLIVLLEKKQKEMRSDFDKIRNETFLQFKKNQTQINTSKQSLALCDLLYENIEQLDNFNQFQICLLELENNLKVFEQTKIINEVKNIVSINDSIDKMNKLINDFQIGLEAEFPIETKFEFTTLGAKGRFGPTSLDGYIDTPLESKVTLINGIQEWKAPVSGNYRITAAGAAGGIGNRKQPKAGYGALLEGTFSIKKDTILRVLVGQKGSDNAYMISCSGGGGGGTFVASFYLKQNIPLIIAGGGNGDSYSSFALNGVNALHNNNGDVNGKRTNGRAGAGGSFTYNGDSYENKGSGISFINGGIGGEKHSDPHGSDGGFGGGGGSLYEGGGGGGYTGGSVVPECDFNGNHENFGAGSFNGGEDQKGEGGKNSGNGYAIIKRIN